MKKMNFMQMENLQGGQTITTSGGFDADYVDSRRINCFYQGTIFFLSVVGTIAGSTGTFGLGTAIGVGLSASAYVDYIGCKQRQM